MANAASAGEYRPKSARITQPIHYADGSVGTITWIKEAAAIKRVRRKLAERNHRLIITREGSQQRIDLGEYAVLDGDGHPLQRHADLSALARFLGCLADGEQIEAPPLRNWNFYVARYEEVEVDGMKAKYAKPITREYTTEGAARRAVAHLKDRTGLVICSFDASVRERRHDA